MRKYRSLPIWFLSFLLFAAQTVFADPIPPSQRILILISLDGFRWDYLDKFHPTNLTRLADEGVRAKKLISCFPSLTFPNHQSIITGLYPEHHGMIANGFYDPAYKTNLIIFGAHANVNEPQWWGGEPIWVTAIKQDRIADCMFWPGSEAKIQGILPTEFQHFNKELNQTQCVDIALSWLAGKTPPSFLTLYFHETDTAGHHDGPDSPELAAAVAQDDAAIGYLLDGVHRLNLDARANIIVVSDHGMTEVSTNRVIALSDFLDPETQVDFAGAIAGIRPPDKNIAAVYQQIKSHEKHFHVYRREDVPSRYHYRTPGRIPPIIMLADEGWYISKRPPQAGRSFEKATHGYDPQLDSMGATFIAYGPAFQYGVTLAPFENIHLYNFLCATLGLKPAPNDGDSRLLKSVLAQ